MASKELIQAVGATAELCGARLSDAGARMLIADLEAYAERDVLSALTRVRRKGKRFSLGSIVEEIDAKDARPGADSAWAMLPRGEADSVVWTTEMAEAWGVAAPLMEIGDKFGAQRAFKEEYTRLCDEARERGTPAQWVASLGHDPVAREHVVRDAINKGRLPESACATLLPAPDLTSSPIVALLTNNANPDRTALDGDAAVGAIARMKAMLKTRGSDTAKTA